MPYIGGVWQVYNGLIKEQRKEGLTLQAIGDHIGVSKERIRQVLTEHYGTTNFSSYITRRRLASLIGCSTYLLCRLEKDGLLKSSKVSCRYLYSRIQAEKATLEVVKTKNKNRIERVCETCGLVFIIAKYKIQKCSPRRFCSRKCASVWCGNTFGFTAHPENVGRR